MSHSPRLLLVIDNVPVFSYLKYRRVNSVIKLTIPNPYVVENCNNVFQAVIICNRSVKGVLLVGPY